MSSSQRSGMVADEPSKGATITLYGMKILELFLLILCIGLIDDPVNSSGYRVFVTSRTVGFTYATLGAFLLFTLIYLIMRFFEDIFPWKTSSLLSLIAALMFLTCAALILRDWANVKERAVWVPNTQRLDLLCGAGAVCVVLSVAYLIDLGITILLGLGGSLDY